MPDLAGNIEEIQHSLKASLCRGRDNLDQNVVAGSKRILLQSIEFKPASAPYSLQCNALKAKYTSLNPSASTPSHSKPATWNGAADQQRVKSEDKETSKTGMEGNDDSLPRPKIILYPEELVKMEWTAKTPTRIGAGLVNMGNTCFFNSTLQCLAYTAPLVNYCMSSDHRQKCKKKDFCMMCEIQAHIRTSLECGGRSIKPHSMLQKLRCIAKHMKWGRQEDAHEFLRFLLDHIQQSCLHGHTKIDKNSKETTVINQIFGGYLRSQVTCLRCQAKSNTFDPFMDLSLDIKGVNTLEDALVKFVKPETLDNENAYKCPKCRNKVRAHKRFSIHKPPNILTIQLNRFDFNRHLYGKINRFIKYPERINLRNYMSQRQGEPILYHLYGVLVHSGHSSDCGHYYSYVKSPSKTWYCMNDSIVHQASYQSVFSADAYVLFYARMNRSSSTPSTPNSHTKVQSQSPHSTPKNSFIGPVLPNHKKQDKSPMVNGLQGKLNGDHSASATRPSPASTPKIVPHASSLPDSHRKISFPLLTTQQKKLQQQQQQEEEDEKDADGKRIVLQIKHGNSTTMEKSPDGKSTKVVNGTVTTLAWQRKTGGLVPYNDDDSSSDDADEVNQKGSASSSSSSKPANWSVHSVAKKPTHELQKSIYSVSASGDNSSAIKSSSSDRGGRLAVPDKAGDAKYSLNKSGHSEKRSLPTKSPFVWDNAQSPTEPSSSSRPKSLDNGKNSSSSSLSKGTPQKDLNFKPGGTTTPSPSFPTTAATTPKSSSKPCLALDVAVASGSKMKCLSGTWHIHPQEGAPSPRGSNSSTNSVNSTSEWNVETKAKAGQSSEERTNSTQAANNKSHASNTSSDKRPAHSAGDVSSKHKNLSASDRSVAVNLSHALQAESKKTLNGKESYDPRSKPPSFSGDRTPVDISDKQSLLSPASSHSSEATSSSKKSGKLKKHKLHLNDRDKSSSSSPSDDSALKKASKKKKKNKKHKKERDDPDSDSDDGASSRKKAKKGQKWSRDASPPSSDDDGYEWVEKKVTTTPPAAKPKHNQVSVQSWNQHVKGDLSTTSRREEMREEEGEEVQTKKSSSKMWDGSRHSKTERVFGGTEDYSNRVLSWDGGKSQLTKDLEEERENKRKRHFSDEYNEEMDAGKVKKVKNHREDNGYGYNPFQDYHHNKKKYEQMKEDSSDTSWSQDHSYYNNNSHHHHHHNNGHKTSSFGNNNGHSKNNWYDKPYNKHNNNNGSSKLNGGGRKFFKNKY